MMKIVLLLVGLLFFFNGHCQTFSSNLPIVVINTGGASIPNEPKITASMGIINNDSGLRNYLTDPFNDYEGKIGIEMRGSSSQDLFPKKQYGIELRDEAGNDQDAALLGMPEEEDWVLFAPYNDKSLMRDVLAYKIGTDLGQYSPRTTYCEVFINDQYMGVYVMIEKIKKDKARVDIATLNPEEISGDDLTGGYIIKLDKTSGNNSGGWTSSYPPPFKAGNQSIQFLFEYPKGSEMPSIQKEYIINYIYSFEKALYSPNFMSHDLGYHKYIDVESFIDYLIVNEVSKNVDGYRLSTYLHKDKDSKGGKLKMGPIWDFNLGFGNANYCTSGNPEGFVLDFNKVCREDNWLIPFWWSKLRQDPYFNNQLYERWHYLRERELKTETILNYIDSVANVLGESQERNFERWPVLGTYVWPNYYVGNSFQAEIDWLKNWIEARLNWLDSHIIYTVITGVQDAEGMAIGMITSPNPFSKEINVSVTVQEPGQFSLIVFDLLGRKIDEFSKDDLKPGSNQITLETPFWSNGFYYLKGKFNEIALQPQRMLKR